MASPEERQFAVSTPQRALGFSVIAAAVGTVPITGLQISGHESVWVMAIDWILWAVFAADLFAGVPYGSNPRFHRILGAVIVVTSFPLLPDLLAATRLVRLARLVRVIRVLAVIGRATPALRATIGRTGFLYVAGLVLFVAITGAGVLAIVEPGTAGFWDALWWALVTTTTVGYGDIAPVSVAGRAIAVVLMILGIGLISSLSASIAAHFIKTDSSERLGRIEARLERLEQALISEPKARD